MQAGKPFLVDTQVRLQPTTQDDAQRHIGAVRGVYGILRDWVSERPSGERARRDKRLHKPGSASSASGHRAVGTWAMAMAVVVVVEALFLPLSFLCA